MSSMYASPLRCLATLAAISLLGCGGDDSTPGSTGTTGGGPSAGGTVSATGGFNGLGGAGLGLGGAVTTLGGSVGTGGAVASGGATQIATASGGTPSSGGATSIVTTKGGATSAGGTTAKGGSTSSGGATAKGGSTSTGGTTAKGGSTSTGGTTAKGGSTSTGGTTAKGGSTSTGGTTAKATTTATGGATGTTPIKVWIAGDSTVATCSSACPCGWGGQFDALFNTNVTVVNSAVGGRSIQTWLYEGNVSSTMGTNKECTLTSTAYSTRWTAMLNATTGMKAGDYLIIQFGINDGDSTCPRHVGTALYKTYLTTMADAAKAVGAIPIYVTPVSMISCSGSTAVASRGFLTETKAAGTANGVAVIDLHQLSINLYNKIGLCPNSSDYTSTTSAVGTFFCADHTHFEAAGAAQIAGVVAQALKDQKIGLGAYLN